MKKFSIFAAAALMLAAVSCNKEAAPIAETEQGTPAVQKITFTAYADNGADTRTILDGNDIKWAAGETIYVFDGTAPRAFTSTNTEEAAIVTFEGEAAVAGTYTAVSPAATLTGSTINATIPVFQTATADSFDPKANVSVAVANGGPDVDLSNLTLQFKNAGAVVKFKLTDNDIVKVRLDAIGGQKLAGKASITLDSDNLPAVAMAPDAESCVILKPASGTFDPTKTYAIAIAPGTYAQGFKLTLFKADGKFKSFSNKNSQTLGRNKMMDFGTIPAVKDWKQSGNDYVDEITRATTGVTGTSYTSWSNKQCSNENHSGAKYAGTTAGGNNSVQFRTSSTSGLISTTSGGTAKSVTIDWNSSTAKEREVEVYGKSEAYSSVADLFDSNKRGTLLGTFIYKSNAATSIEINGDYKYIGIRSKKDALYLNKISIAWHEGGDASAPVDPQLTNPAFEIVDVTPASGVMQVEGGTASFIIHSDLPWVLSADNVDNIPYAVSEVENGSKVTATFSSIESGNRSLTFTITPSEGDARTVTFVQRSAPTSETIDLTTQGYERGDEVSTVAGDAVTLVFNQGTNTNTPKYYDDSVRVYGGGYFTVSSSFTIKKVEITFGENDGSNAITTDSGSYSSGVWTGAANSVKFTIGGSSGNRRIKSVKVTF